LGKFLLILEVFVLNAKSINGEERNREKKYEKKYLCDIFWWSVEAEKKKNNQNYI